ncbi:MAG: 3-dehydroquinate synthase [Erysipelotrichaceae bacterium]
MKLQVNLETTKYDIILKEGVLSSLNQYLNLKRKVMIISDCGVPSTYIDDALNQCPKGFTYIVEQGESSKSLATYQKICETLLEKQFTRKDLILAIGGGVVGDLSGFVAATYMRGIDFVNIPTTTLSQIDSSIGGKVGINLDQVKNILGCFYQPKMVLIDPLVLKTLPHRHYINGLIEAIKAGLIYDPVLFECFEEENIDMQLTTIIERSLQVKKSVVEQDEKEQHLRKILNFGHTIGHGLETLYGLHDLLHGEAVALGMLYFIENEPLKIRVEKIYDRLGIKKDIPYNKDELWEFIKNDKKATNSTISVVVVSQLGKAQIKEMSFDELKTYLKG